MSLSLAEGICVIILLVTSQSYTVIRITDLMDKKWLPLHPKQIRLLCHKDPSCFPDRGLLVIYSDGEKEWEILPSWKIS